MDGHSIADMNTETPCRIGSPVWLTFAVVTTIYMCSLFYRMAPSVLALSIAEDLGTSLSEVSVIGSAVMLGFGMAQIPAGLLSDSIGGKKTLLGFTLLAGLSTIGFSMAATLDAISVSRFFTGVGISATVPCASILAHRVPPHLFARISCLMYGCGGLGIVFASAPVALMNSTIGWRNTMLGCGLFSVVLAVLLFTCVPEKPHGPAQEKNAHAHFSLLHGLRIVLGSPHFWKLCTVYSCILLTYFGFYGLWFGPYLEQACGLSKLEAGSVLSMGSFANIPGMILIALISDKIRSRKWPIIFFSASAMLSIFALTFFPGRLSVPALTGIALVLSFSCALTGIAFTSGKELFPLAIMGAATGCLNTLPCMLGAAGQKIFGMLLEASPDFAAGSYASAYSHAMIFYAVAISIAFLASLTIKETHPERP